jgi:hypothetical protein
MAGGERSGHGGEWRRRYAGRGLTQREAHARQYVDGGLATWDPDGPFPGIDGAMYAPGGLDIDQGFPEPLPVVLVTTRAMSEVITGWSGFPQMLGWVASRGTTGTGELGPPAAAASARCVREDLILAHALRSPADLPAIARYLPADTFTSDIRYDLFTVMLEVARAGRRVGSDTVAGALQQRAAQIPARHWQEHYGGRGLPWAVAYLRRIAQTWAGRDAARAAAVSLRGEDRQAIARQVGRPGALVAGPRRVVQGGARPRRAAVPARTPQAPAPVPVAARAQVPMPVFQPAVLPGARGPVPGM